MHGEKIVPLVVRRGNERLVIGEAKVFVSGLSANIDAQITDPEWKEKLKPALSGSFTATIYLGPNYMNSIDTVFMFVEGEHGQEEASRDRPSDEAPSSDTASTEAIPTES